MLEDKNNDWLSNELKKEKQSTGDNYNNQQYVDISQSQDPNEIENMNLEEKVEFFRNKAQEYMDTKDSRDYRPKLTIYFNNIILSFVMIGVIIATIAIGVGILRCLGGNTASKVLSAILYTVPPIMFVLIVWSTIRKRNKG